jgi:hypothetical protein
MTRREESFERAEARDKPDRIVLTPAGATAETQAIVVYDSTDPKVPFRDALISWNCETPKGTGLVIELRVARTTNEADWSQWMRVQAWGDLVGIEGEKVVSTCDGGRIDQGIFLGDHDFARLQVRVRGLAATKSAKNEIVVRRLSIEVRNRTVSGDKQDTGTFKAIEVDVPFVAASGLRGEGADLAASIAMLLGSKGVDVSAKRVAELMRLPSEGCAGALGVQAAFSLGGACDLTSIAYWGKLEIAFRLGVAAAIQVQAKAGELKGTPEGAPERRWMVIMGFDKDGNCLVRDPSAPDGGRSVIVYSRQELERAWIGKGGTAVLMAGAVRKAKGK